MGGAEQFRIGPDDDPDRYRLERLHSSGAEGQVWRGSRELEGDVVLDVAVKILHAERQDLMTEWRDRWSEQVELLRSLQYPGVVPVREAFEGPFMHPVGERGPKGRSLYLVMNWMEGESLHEWVSRRPGADVFQALRLLTQVADALDYMHSGRATGGKPVVHRDVKPANIIVSGEVAVLVDFGLVRALTKEAPLAPGIGTVSYMAPEVLSKGLYTPESDRYALGCVAYYMLTNEDPPADADAAVMRSKLAKVPALGGNPSLLSHLMTMLDPDPAARPLRATAWVQLFRSSTLTEAGGKADLPPIRPTGPSVPEDTVAVEPPRRRRSPVWLGVGLVVALVLAVAAYTLLRDSSGGTQLAAQSATTTSTVGPTTSSTVGVTTSITRPATSIAAGTTVAGQPVVAGGTTANAQYLEDLPYDNSGSVDHGTLQVMGEALIRSLIVYPSVNQFSQLTYKLGGRYQRFVARLGIGDRSGTNLRLRFQIFGDGPTALFDRVLGKDEIYPVDLQINKTSRLQLVAIVVQEGSTSTGVGAFGEARVVP